MHRVAFEPSQFVEKIRFELRPRGYLILPCVPCALPGTWYTVDLLYTIVRDSSFALLFALFLAEGFFEVIISAKSTSKANCRDGVLLIVALFLFALFTMNTVGLQKWYQDDSCAPIFAPFGGTLVSFGSRALSFFVQRRGLYSVRAVDHDRD